MKGVYKVEVTPQSANVPKSCLTAFINYEMTFLHFELKLTKPYLKFLLPMDFISSEQQKID